MRLCRFGDGRLGLVEGSWVRDVTAALEVLPAYRYPLPSYDVLIAHLDAVRQKIAAIADRAPILPLAGLKLLSPVANPGKIIAAPVNYRKHLEEVRTDAALHHNRHLAPIHESGLFLKAVSSLVGPGEGITLRKPERRTDHEVELAFIVGKTASHVRREDALGYIAGYAIGLDISIRGPEDRSLRKSCDSYTVVGPWLVTADEVGDPGALDLSIAVDGQIRQHSNTRHLILSVPELLEFASSFYTLYPGDIVLTGTPEGVSPLEPGNTIVASIDRIGTMEVRVWAAKDEARRASEVASGTPKP